MAVGVEINVADGDALAEEVDLGDMVGEVLALGGALEQGVEPIGAEQVLQDRPGHHTDGAARDERLKDVG